MPVPITATQAQQLSYYKAEDGPGVLGPRGWQCFSTYGSDGSTLYVAPQMPQHKAFFNDSFKGFTGPVIQLSIMSGGTSGRFSVADTIALVFPAYLPLAWKVQVEPPTHELPTMKYPKDKLHYLSEAIAEYRTPAGIEGFGTWSKLLPSDLPISGVALLTGADTDCVDLSVRLPSELSSLGPAIIEHVVSENRNPPPPKP